MKKILIATSALAFAGSAFAADVSGYAISAYQKTDSEKSLYEKSLYSDTEVYFSGSKTASNGLTFGANYTIGFVGDSIAAVEPDKNIGKVNTFVSGSFGKVEMGTHNSAARQIGSSSTDAGSYVVKNNSDATRTKLNNAVTYTSPVFYGVQIAYSKVFGTDQAKSVAIKYTGTFSGVGVALAHGEDTAAIATGTGTGTGAIAKGEIAKTTGTGIKISKGAFSVSYAVAKTSGVASITDKTKRIGLGYSANKVTIGFSQKKTGSVKSTSIYGGYDVASGLTVFVENKKTSGSAVPNENTKTTWVGTKISF